MKKKYGVEAHFVDVDDIERIEVVARASSEYDTEMALYEMVSNGGLWFNGWFLPMHRVKGLRVAMIGKDSAANLLNGVEAH